MRTSVVLCTFLGAWASCGLADVADPRLAASRDIAQDMQSALKGELMQAMASVGPVGAIEVCRTRAPAIAAHVGNEAGVRVSRTALRLRNGANAPDEPARAVLEDFVARLGQGAAPDTLEHFEASPDGGARYLKAIVTQPPCLACHGAAIAEPVRRALAGHYPGDAATGFAVGELRGAVLVEWPAHPEDLP